jgi:nitroreductase
VRNPWPLAWDSVFVSLPIVRRPESWARVTLEKDLAMNDTIGVINSLHTTHGNFDPARPVSEADLSVILRAATSASSASGTQSYSIVVLCDPAIQKEVCGYTASHALIFCVDYTRLLDCARHLGHDFSPGGIIGFITGSTNTILAAQTAAIAAKSLGIDYLITNGIHRGNMSKIYERLGLPENACFPLVTLYLGYADRPPEHVKGRLRGLGVVHREQYHRLTAEEIKAVIAEQEGDNAVLNPNWKTEGFAHYLDWFFTRWTRPAAPEKLAEFYRILRRAGFVDTAGANSTAEGGPAAP